MPLYLAASPERLETARAATLRLAHVAYRLGAGSRLLAAPLPAALRGGLMLLSDWDCPPVEEPGRLAGQIVQVCHQRRYAGVVLDWEEPPAADRWALLRELGPLLQRCGRRLLVPEHYAGPESVVLLCTAISGGTLRQRLEQAVAQYGPEHLALDLQRLVMDFPLPSPSGQGRPLSLTELSQLRRGQNVFYSDGLCARYFTRSGPDGTTHMVLFDDAQTLRRKLALGRSLGIRDALVMLPEVEDLLRELFEGEA